MKRVGDRWAFRFTLVMTLATQLVIGIPQEGVWKALGHVVLLILVASMGAAAVLEWAGYFEWLRTRRDQKPDIEAGP